jgi:hypothetical protein
MRLDQLLERVRIAALGTRHEYPVVAWTALHCTDYTAPTGRVPAWNPTAARGVIPSMLGIVAAMALAVSCPAHVGPRLLPVWARAGFSDPRPHIPYVLGAKRSIVAILFATPLTSPPSKDHNNKILWVPRVAAAAPSDLRISAQRFVGGRPVGHAIARRVQGGPGPSSVDLPAAGCYRFELRWSGRSDTLWLAYAPGP